MIEVINLQELITQFAISKNQCVMYFKPVGVDSETDVDKINAVWDHYSNIVPPEIMHGIKYSLHNFAFFIDKYTAIQRMEEWFPYRGEMPEEYYVYVCITDAEGNCVTENEATLPPD